MGRCLWLKFGAPFHPGLSLRAMELESGELGLYPHLVALELSGDQPGIRAVPPPLETRPQLLVLSSNHHPTGHSSPGANLGTPGWGYPGPYPSLFGSGSPPHTPRWGLPKPLWGVSGQHWGCSVWGRGGAPRVGTGDPPNRQPSPVEACSCSSKGAEMHCGGLSPRGIPPWAGDRGFLSPLSHRRAQLLPLLTPVPAW